jgi:hypothetical protein
MRKGKEEEEGEEIGRGRERGRREGRRKGKRKGGRDKRRGRVPKQSIARVRCSPMVCCRDPNGHDYTKYTRGLPLLLLWCFSLPLPVSCYEHHFRKGRERG